MKIVRNGFIIYLGTKVVMRETEKKIKKISIRQNPQDIKKKKVKNKSKNETDKTAVRAESIGNVSTAGRFIYKLYIFNIKNGVYI